MEKTEERPACAETGRDTTPDPVADRDDDVAWLERIAFDALTKLHAAALAEWPDPVVATTVPVGAAALDTTGNIAGPNRARRAGLAIGSVVLLLGTLFAITSLRAGTHSSDTPEHAVRATLAALGSGDVLGALETIAPAERGVLTDEGIPILDELERLGDLGDIDLSRVRGITFDTRTLELHTLSATTSTATVEVRGPVRVVADQLDLFAGPSVIAAGAPAPGAPKPEIATQIALRRVDGAWFVSVTDTATLTATLNTATLNTATLNTATLNTRTLNTATPNTATVTTTVSAQPLDPRGLPAGAPSPEELGRDLARAVQTRDYRRVVELLAPDECAVTEESTARLMGLVPQYLALLGDAPAPAAAPDGNELPRSEPTRGGARVYLDSSSVRVGPNLALTSFIAVERDGNWYLSPGRSILRLVRDRLAATTAAAPSPTATRVGVLLQRLVALSEPAVNVGFDAPRALDGAANTGGSTR